MNVFQKGKKIFEGNLVKKNEEDDDRNKDGKEKAFQFDSRKKENRLERILFRTWSSNDFRFLRSGLDEQ
jgi:hypothetical protein